MVEIISLKTGRCRLSCLRKETGCVVVRLKSEVSGLVIWSEETTGTKQTRHKPGLRAWQSVLHLCNVKSNIKTRAF